MNPSDSADRPRNPECIFCKIAAGEIPSYKVYEDDDVLAFLDVGPLCDGHTLVIPKAHYATLDEMPGELVAACTRMMPQLGKAIQQATGAGAWNLLQNNGRLAHQEVGHVHFHLIPKTENAGLGITWPSQELSRDVAGELQQKIAGQMDQG
ncbi:MAG: HIT family protein [Phycisphaeraceae bacterium]